MIILNIASNTRNIFKDKILLESEGIVVRNIDASSLSFLTSMRIATACKKYTPTAVVAYRLKDVVGALSARKLEATADHPLPYPIIFYIDEDTKIPVRLTDEVKNGIDAYVFDSAETAKAWTGIIDKEPKILPLPGEDIRIEDNADSQTTTVIYIGPIGEGNRLRTFLDKAEGHPEVKIRVLGTGKARFVMPIVKKMRATNVNITWVGDDYDEEAEMKAADAWIVSRNSPTEKERVLLANGRPGIKSVEELPVTDEMRKDARKTFESEYTHEIFVGRLKELITRLSQ